MKTIDIRVPGTVKEMTFQHLPFLEELGNIKNEGLEIDEIPFKRMAEMISSFTNIPYVKVTELQEKSIMHLFIEIAKTFEMDVKHKEEALPLQIEVEGQEYELVDDFEKLPIKWRIDVSEAGDLIKEKPELIPAFLYIEKGMKYGELDDHKNIKNSIFKRAEIFKANMKLDLFLKAQGFFLQAWKNFEPLKETKERLRKNKDINSTGNKTYIS